MIPIKVPTVGESITEVVLLRWVKKTGEYVKRDEVIAELESEKATFEVNAEQAGILITKVEEGVTLQIGDALAEIDDTASVPTPSVVQSASVPASDTHMNVSVPPVSALTEPVHSPTSFNATPLAQKIIREEKINPENIQKNEGKIQKNDVLHALQQSFTNNQHSDSFSRNERKEKLTQLRKVISRRLVEAKNTTAMLTTFNEIDMSQVMEVRTKYKEQFKKVHGVNLGFMSFFTKACTIALKEFPAVNAYIDSENITYHDFCDISIAVSAPKGLVVPVIRNAESLTMAGIEKKVVELATKAKENKLTIEEMTGGTFTITNGGIFGSLMSTPIINIPQSAILGMHTIQERPIAVKGKVEIRPMMYIALSYDHRIIDGREAVGFLVRVKQLLEFPRLLFSHKDPMLYVLDL